MRLRGLLLFLLSAWVLVPGHAPAAAEAPVLDGEVYVVDNAHSLLDFTVRQVGFARVRGTFKKYRAAIFYVDDDPEKSSVSVAIEVNSIDTGNDSRDRHLRSKDFFEVEQFPLIQFHSERVEKTTDGFVVVGPLTIKETTREVRIPFQVISKKATDQFQNQRIVFEGQFALNRRDFGVVGPDFWNNLISDPVEIDLAVAGRVFNFLNPFGRWREKSIGKAALDMMAAEGVEATQERLREIWRTQKEDYLFELRELYVAGMQLAQGGQAEEAIGLFELAADLFAGSAEAQDLAAVQLALGETYARQGDRGKAVASVEKALALDPDSPKGHELIRRLKE